MQVLLGHEIPKIAYRSEERCRGSYSGGRRRRKLQWWSEEDEVVGDVRGANGDTNRGERRCERSRSETNGVSGAVRRRTVRANGMPVFWLYD